MLWLAVTFKKVGPKETIILLDNIAGNVESTWSDVLKHIQSYKYILFFGKSRSLE